MNNGARTANVASKVGGAGPGHNGWMMTSSALVLFMTLPGLALFYGGLVRRKNVLSVLAQCLGIESLEEKAGVPFSVRIRRHGRLIPGRLPISCAQNHHSMEGL